MPDDKIRTTIGPICGCDGFFDAGCPACTPEPAPPPARHPADVRWQPAHGNCANPVQPPAASDIAGAPCKLIWVRRDDWDAFLEWQAEGIRHVR